MEGVIRINERRELGQHEQMGAQETVNLQSESLEVGKRTRRGGGGAKGDGW